LALAPLSLCIIAFFYSSFSANSFASLSFLAFSSASFFIFSWAASSA
jgi:hypothetical protein